jgi:hypothetical protein
MLSVGGGKPVCLVALLTLVGPALPAAAGSGDAAAQEAEETSPASGLRPHLEFGFEIKAHFRDSEENRFRVPFPFTPDMLPPGQTAGFEETVNAGSHLELSTATLLLDATWSPGLTGHLKVDVIDLYDRNPTSTDRNIDVDEAWFRFGRETDPAALPERSGAYLKVGKMPKFERQDDRHLESYGLVSTAFNRFEDFGLEAGVDLGRHAYVKASLTSGNPVFLRDPNALAGDNGTAELLRPFPDPELKSGIVIPYDAEVEDFAADGNLETGAGLGLRFADAGGRNGVDLLAWGYRRKLADTVALNGSFYGGDLDLLRGPENQFPFPLTSDDKREVGGNLWLYLGGGSLFAQYVDQDLGGLGRTGIEAEAAWRFDLPLKWSSGGRQLFPSIAPAARYSRLDPDFAAPAVTPSPSFAWQWTKIDYGVRVGLVVGVDLTLEYADNDFVLKSGAHRSNNEFLATLRWRG